MGRPRKYATNAERQKAYRERHRDEKDVTKTAWLPGFVAETWGEFPVDVSQRGRPRQWYDDTSRKRAWWMRHVAVQYEIAGVWMDEAERIEQERQRRALIRRPMLPVELGEPREMCEAA
jgi:hypothetical protein